MIPTIHTMIPKLLDCMKLQNYHNLTNGTNLLLAWLMSSLVRHNYDHLPLLRAGSTKKYPMGKDWGKNYTVAPGSDSIIYYWVSFPELFGTLTFLDREFKKSPGRFMWCPQGLMTMALMYCTLALLHPPPLLSMGLLATPLSCFPEHTVSRQIFSLWILLNN